MFSSLASSLASYVLTLSMLFSSSSAPSGSSDLYDRISQNYTNADVAVTFSIDSQIDQTSLEILDEMFYSDSYFSDSGMSIKSLINGLADSSIKFSMKYNTGEKTGSLYISSDIAALLAFSNNLDITANIRSSYWIDYNFTSIENFKCEIISYTPANTKYVLMDLSKMLDEREKKELLDTSSNGTIQILSIQEQSKNLLKENSSVTIDEKNHAKIVLSEDQLENYIIGLLKIFSNEMINEEGSMHTGIQPIEDTLDLSFIKPIEEFFEKSSFFADEAIVCDYYFDDNKNITSAVSSVNFSFNLKNVWLAAENLSFAEETKDTPKPDMDFDIDGDEGDPWHKLPDDTDDFVFSLKANIVYNEYNKYIDTQKPVLTDKNSVNKYEQYIAQNIHDYYNDYVPKYKKIYVSEYGNAFFRPQTTIPLRSAFDDLCYYDADITYDSGNITILSNGSSDLFDEINLTVGSCEAVVDQKTYTLSQPITLLDGNARLPEDFFKTIWNGELESIRVETINKIEDTYYYETTYTIRIPNPNYSELIDGAY